MKKTEINTGLIYRLFEDALGYEVTDIKTKGNIATVTYRDNGKVLKKAKKKVAKK